MRFLAVHFEASSIAQILLSCVAIVFIILLFFALLTLFRNLTLYRSGLDKLPQPPFPSTNVFNILIRGNGLLNHVYFSNPDDNSEYYNSVRKPLNTDVFVLTGPSFASNVLVFTASAVRTIAQSSSQVYGKPWTVRLFIKLFVGEGSIFVSEGVRHRRLRHAMSIALKHDNLVKLSRYFIERGDALAQELADSGDADPVFGIRRATFDIIINACFGQHAVNDDTIQRILNLYHNALTDQRGIYLLIFMGHIGVPFIPLSWVFPGERSKLKVRREVHQLCSKLLSRWEEKRHSGGDGSCDEVVPLLSIMCDACEEGKFTAEDLVQTVLSFLLAGQATTTIGLAWTFYLLARHGDWQARVYDEIRDNWKGSDDITVLDELPLLNRVVKESIRLYPPVQGTLRKAEKEVVIDGHVIPAGAMIRLPFAAIQRRDDFWGPDAHTFNPDRFITLDNHPDTRWLWTAFWFGTHSCIGQRFALLEIKALVATMLLKFHMSVREDTDGRPYRYGTDQSPRNLKLYYQRR